MTRIQNNINAILLTSCNVNLPIKLGTNKNTFSVIVVQNVKQDLFTLNKTSRYYMNEGIAAIHN